MQDAHHLILLQRDLLAATSYFFSSSFDKGSYEAPFFVVAFIKRTTTITITIKVEVRPLAFQLDLPSHNFLVLHFPRHLKSEGKERVVVRPDLS